MAVIRRNCPHCPAEHVAFVLTWADRVPGQSYKYNCIAVCGACGGPICFQAEKIGHGSPPTQANGEIVPSWDVDGGTWPTRTASTAPPHTPESVRRRFLEGEDAYQRHSWNAAVAMYRSALDVATKGMDGVPPGKTFYKRLEWLHENHRITPDIRSWADHVRIEGNEALHDPDDFTEEDAKPLRLFTEMFLRYVFELPGEVRAFRGETEANEPPPSD